MMEDAVEITVYKLVQIAAALYADRRAVCFDECTNHAPRSYTYSEVAHFAEEITHFLQSHCDPAENCEIGLYCSPGLNLPSWILGILQVPAAYSPIDPDAPPNVSSYFMRRCDLKSILVQNDKAEEFTASYSKYFRQKDFARGPVGVTLFKIQWNDSSQNLLEPKYRTENDSFVKTKCRHDKNNLLKQSHKTALEESMGINEKHCLAYVLHTSGTTGTPKIVRVPHKCIAPNIQHLRSIFNITEHDLLFLASPLTFDPSVVELFAALSSGACLLIVPKKIKMMPRKLCNALFHRHKVTVLQVTPTLLRTFGTQCIRSKVLSAKSALRVLALGGEAFPSLGLLKKWREDGNQTEIFNLYGVTEVSCWATYYRIPEELFSTSARQEYSVQLGSPLFGTQIEVRDSSGLIVEEGEGQIFLGGKERICFLDDEISVEFGKMRETGDWVNVKDGNIYFLGRKDNQIKRHGQRLCIEHVQQVVEGLDQVETCAVAWYQEEKLVLFVVPRQLVEKANIFVELREHLSSYEIPDDILVIESLPLTSHGKIDTAKLNEIYAEYLCTRTCVTPLQNEEELWRALQSIWKSLLGTSDVTFNVPKDSVFLYSGGDSLKSLRFQEELENLVGKTVPGLLEVILHDNISDIHAHVSKALFNNEDQFCRFRHNLKRKLSPTESDDFIRESVKQNPTEAPSTGVKETPGFIALSRGNMFFLNSPSGQVRPEFGHLSSDPQRASGGVDEVNIRKLAQEMRSSNGRPDTTVDDNTLFIKHTSEPAHQLLLNVRWKSDTGKCVDASPLAVMSYIDHSSGTIYIGSHSHRMQSLDLFSGKLQWERLLGDRIESSACMSKCGKFIIVGCYNGIVYVLKRHNGEIYWTFNTENAVKSSPTVDPSTGLVFIGSHDQNAYALNVHEKECVWKQHCGAGAIFSSPCFSMRPYQLYVATLGGLLLALNPGTGSIIWKTSCGKPLFSSPACSSESVYAGCVDGNIYCFSHSGEKKWQYSANGPIFSTPCISSLPNQDVFFGSHDGFVYCCDIAGNLRWKFETCAKVYATSFSFCDPRGVSEALVVAASTDGTLWILAAESGLPRTTYTLPGEVFSSPIVCGTKLVVGCRNDYVYCLDLCSSERKNSPTCTV